MITAGFNQNESSSSSCEGINQESELKRNAKLAISDKIAQYYSNKVMQEQQIQYLNMSPEGKNGKQLKDLLVNVTLTGEELDKFKAIKTFPDLRVLVTFYCDEALDHAFFQ